MNSDIEKANQELEKTINDKNSTLEKILKRSSKIDELIIKDLITKL